MKGLGKATVSTCLSLNLGFHLGNTVCKTGFQAEFQLLLWFKKKKTEVFLRVVRTVLFLSDSF